MKRYSCFLILSAIISAYSCEGYSGGSGVVLDYNSSAIKEAQVVLLLDGKEKDTVYTDSLGRFNIGNIVGFIFECPKSTLRITKNGFKSVSINLEEEEEKDSTFTTDSVRVVLTPVR